MLRCAECNAVNLERSSRCGVCGASVLVPWNNAVSPVSVQRPFRPPSDRLKGLAVLLVGLAVLVIGTAFSFLPIDPSLNGVGFYVMIIGALIMLSILGVFAGTPYKGNTGRALNRVDRELKRKKKREYSD